MKPIIDICCGSKQFYFDKNNADVCFMDIREGDFPIQKKDGIRNVLVKPDVIADFRHIPFEDNSFYMVVFDPPHLYRMGQNSMLTKLYGRLNFDTWKEDLKAGFDEAWRILKPNGTLIFKWCETDIKLSEVVKVFDKTPIFGNRSSKNNTTHWLVYMKIGQTARVKRS